MKIQEQRAPWGFYTYHESGAIYILDDFGNAVDLFKTRAYAQWAHQMTVAYAEIANGYMIH